MDYEKRPEPLATVQQIGRVAWDALEQYIVLEVSLGETRARTTSAFLNLTPPAALQLLLELQELLEETGGAAAPMQ